MSTKHTPGPWYVGRPGQPDPTYPHWVISEQHPIATVCGYAGDASPANARLLAAAPELLEALKDALDYVPYNRAQAARAAIAKATGEA